MLASLLAKHGIKEAVISPGSRNAPLIVAMERQTGINTRVVIDERSAAFMALGISNASNNYPVALVCTSGTASLNYAPAVAEAFYRHSPLIVITADRPAEWIDQDDSQTINQLGIFNNFIKASYDIPVESDEPDRMWMINRTLTDAIIMATDGCPGPVHINVRLADPLGETAEYDETDIYGDSTRCVNIIPNSVVSDKDIFLKEICDSLLPPNKVLILAGFMIPSGLDDVLKELAERPNIVVMHEAQSNLHGSGMFLPHIDATLRYIGKEPEEKYCPDLVITIGGSLTSRMVKAWLRSLPNLKHWNIGLNNHSIDCFRKLSLRIPLAPLKALTVINDALPKKEVKVDTEYKELWHKAALEALKESELWAENSPWCDFKAMCAVMNAIPTSYNIQLSNGTAVRYAQLFDYSRAARIDCNRGVSGIDGCTSTAIGAALVHEKPTVLITGDMSMQYDLGALACSFIPSNFKIIVLNNGGGGIFRFIRSTKNLDELQKDFVADVRLPLEELSSAFGFRYLRAANESELDSALNEIFGNDTKPAILEILTDGDVSAKRLSQFFES